MPLAETRCSFLGYAGCGQDPKPRSSLWTKEDGVLVQGKEKPGRRADCCPARPHGSQQPMEGTSQICDQEGSALGSRTRETDRPGQELQPRAELQQAEQVS